LLRQARLDGRHIDPTDLTTALDDIHRESDRMRRLVEDLLLLARADADAGSDPDKTAPIRRELVRLDEIASEAVRSAEALASGQVLELEAPRGVEVDGDSDRLHQLVMILLDNAIRHTPSGGTIRVARPMVRRASPSATKGKGSPPSTYRTCSSGSTGPMERAAGLQVARGWGWLSPRPFVGLTAATSR
jgi:K+-sensing histidine kinase KdpD